MKYKIKIAADSSELQCLYSQNIEYYDYGNCKRHLQILFPYKPEMRADEKYPLILFIPGSAWHKQEMYNDIPQYALLAKRGFVVAAMEYRESDISVFPAQIEDVYNALNFIPSIADNFHIDTNKIFLMGNSSGGHIAMMSVLFNAHGLCKELPKISGVICESGSTDLLVCAKEELPPWMKIRPSEVLLGIDKIEGHEELAKKASCSMYISEDIKLPPILLMHSEYDPIVSVENSRILYEKLAASSHDVIYYELEENSAHGGLTYYNDKILGIVEEFCKKRI
jgi:acetyl esterase/lipase